MDIESSNLKVMFIVFLIGLIIGGSLLSFFKKEGGLTKEEYDESLSKVETLLDLNYTGITPDIKENAKTNDFYIENVSQELYNKRFKYDDKEIYNYYLGRYQGYRLSYELKDFSIMKGDILDSINSEESRTFLAVIELIVRSIDSGGEYRYIIPIYGITNENGQVIEFGEI